MLREHLRRDARIRVLLVDHGRDAELLRRADHRAADIAAGADADIRLKLPDDLFCLRRGRENADDRLRVALDVLEGELALEAGDPDRAELEARRRNEALLHAALVADVQDLRVRLLFPEIARRRQRRVDVAGRAAARK